MQGTPVELHLRLAGLPERAPQRQRVCRALRARRGGGTAACQPGSAHCPASGEQTRSAGSSDHAVHGTRARPLSGHSRKQGRDTLRASWDSASAGARTASRSAGCQPSSACRACTSASSASQLGASEKRMPPPKICSSSTCFKHMPFICRSAATLYHTLSRRSFVGPGFADARHQASSLLASALHANTHCYGCMMLSVCCCTRLRSRRYLSAQRLLQASEHCAG